MSNSKDVFTSKSTNNLNLLLSAATEISKNSKLVDIIKSVDVTWRTITCDDGYGNLSTLVLPDIKIEFLE